MRPWTKPESRSDAVYERLLSTTDPAKTMSKLDSARLKLSQLKLKYGKQEKRQEMDSSSSSTELSFEKSSTKTPLTMSSKAKVVPNEPFERFDEEQKLEVNNRDGVDRSEKTETDSLRTISKHNTLIAPEKELPLAGLPHEKIKLEFSITDHKRVESSQSDSSGSEISENVHSFSSLLQIETQLKDDSLVKKKHVVPVMVQEREETQSSVSFIASVSCELQSKQSDPEFRDQDTSSVMSLPSKHEVFPEIQALGDSSSVLSFSNDLEVVPVVIVKENQSRLSSVAASSKEENRKETSSTLRVSPEKSSNQISSPTLIIPKRKKGTTRRNAKVQTHTKEPRKVYLSSTESNYGNRICPNLRASSLPPGLRINDDLDDPLDILGMEADAMHILLKSQIYLTLSLLRREQALYLNSCSAAARLERAYRKHTLSDTRKFIRREKRLRGELRDVKLEKGLALKKPC